MPTSRYFTGLTRNTFLLALASLFADISTEMLVPILPLFLTFDHRVMDGGTVARALQSFERILTEAIAGELAAWQ